MIEKVSVSDTFEMYWYCIVSVHSYIWQKVAVSAHRYILKVSTKGLIVIQFSVTISSFTGYGCTIMKCNLTFFREIDGILLSRMASKIGIIFFPREKIDANFWCHILMHPAEENLLYVVLTNFFVKTLSFTSLCVILTNFCLIMHHFDEFLGWFWKLKSSIPFFDAIWCQSYFCKYPIYKMTNVCLLYQFFSETAPPILMKLGV